MDKQIKYKVAGRSDKAAPAIKRIREGRFMVAAASADIKSDKTSDASRPFDVDGPSRYDRPLSASTSGDAAGACSLPDGRLAFILSDGMGKGMKAAAESQAVVKELRKLLKKGIQPSRAIKIVNKTLIDNDLKKEAFATLDLTIIDRNHGHACFYKMGASSSFLVRNRQVKRIQHAALPVGMVRRIKASQIKIKLLPGDTLIIVSDGITDADRQDLEAKWLQEYLTNISKNIDPKTLAGEIAGIAQSKYKSRQTDDITVLAIQIR